MFLLHHLASLKRLFLLAGLACLGLPAPAAPAPTVTVEPGAKAGELQVKVVPLKTTATGLLEVVNPQNGKVLKTLHAGRFAKEQVVPLVRDPALPAGKYKIRYREGIALAMDVALPPPTKSKSWINPVDLVLTDKSIFVFDANRPQPAAGTAPATPAPDEIDNPYLCKFSAKDGTPDQAFGSGGVLELPKEARNTRGFAVDEEDCIYMSYGGHNVQILDTAGELLKGGAIGGWDNDPLGPRCTTWVNSVALGRDKKIYIPVNGYDGAIRAYDRTKSEFKGFLFKSRTCSVNRADRYITVDPVSGALYLIETSGQVRRYNDTGKEIKFSWYHASNLLPSLAGPMGPSASGGLIWVVAHGGDAHWGLQHVAALYWDNGSKIRYIGRFGKPGAAPDQPEFLNPIAATQSADHLTLWVVEDGQENLLGEPSNHRVRRFKITSVASAEAEATITN
jgi:hypothetical protein